MKKTFVGIAFLSILWLSSCGGAATSDKNINTASTTAGLTEQSGANTGSAAENSASNTSTENVVQLTKAMFLEKIYDFEKNPKKWTFIGDKPCVIDFYADWCRPCKMVAPIMAEFSETYKGQVNIYKVDIDKERELAQFFGIQSIPTVLFCPSNGDPQMTQGALPKETFEKVITEFLLQKKVNN